MRTGEFVRSPQNATRDSKLFDWVAVAGMLIGFSLAAVGLILLSFGIAVAGAVLFVVSGLGAWANGIMAHTEPQAEGERAYASTEDEVPVLKEDRRVIPQ